MSSLKPLISLGASLCFLTLTPKPLQAQIIPDTTLGSENTTLTPQTPINGQLAEQIDGGAIRGVNLFHSFLEFNINDGQRVYFHNPTGITNIFSRVTGSHPSNILGTLGVDGNANLFLLNPNGIFFGPNAQLDINGSFLATTAHRLFFGDGLEFSATNPQPAPLLTVNLQPGLQYGDNPQGIITSRGILSVGENLTLAAPQLDIQGQLYAGQDLTLKALDTLKIRDTLTHPFIAVAEGKLTLQGDEKLDIFALNHPDSGLFSGQDMILRSANPVLGDAHYWSGGSFRVENLEQTPGDLHSPNDPIVYSLGDVLINEYTGTSLHILAGGRVNIANITITGPDATGNTINPITTPNLSTVTLSDGTTVQIDGTNRATVDIRAGMDTQFIGLPGIIGANFTTINGFAFPTVTNAEINIGNITINVPDSLVLLTNYYQTNPNLQGDITLLNGGVIKTSSTVGNGGDVFINSRNNINLNGLIDTASTVGNAGTVHAVAKNLLHVTQSINTNSTNGNGGLINLEGTELNISNSLNSSSLQGNGGHINLKSQGNLWVQGAISTASQAGRSGDVNIRANNNLTVNRNIQSSSTGLNSGNITLEAILGNITLNNALVNSNTFGAGQAGNLTVKAGQDVILNNQAELLAGTRSSGRGAVLNLDAQNLRIVNGSGLYSNTNNSGHAGTILLNIANTIDLDRGFIFVNTVGGTGNAGNLVINSQNFSAKNGSLVSAFSQGSGRGGDIVINASNSLQLTGNNGSSTGLFLGATNSGNAGNLSVSTPRLTLEEGASIYASTSGLGQAGNVTINASGFLRVIGTSPDGLLRSSLYADTFGGGNAGNFTIQSPLIEILNGGQISASTISQGNAGLLNVNGQNLTVAGQSNNGLASRLLFESQQAGNAGQLNINVSNVQVKDSGTISAITTNTGDGGRLTVNTDNFQVLNNGSVRFDSSGTRDAGQLAISTRQFTLDTGGQVSATTSGSGQGGILDVNAQDFVRVFNNARLSFDSSGTGDAGQLTISTRQFTLDTGGQVSATTSGSGQGGILGVNAQDFVKITGAGSRLNLASLGSGNARELNINTGDLTVENRGEISISGLGTGRAGDLNIKARSMFLNQQGNLLARTISGEGGNITLEVAENLILRYNSNILTEALGTGNGGNIFITAGGYVLAILSENSDIAATAIEGRGGNIFVRALGIFGFSNPGRLVRTPQSDLSASSTLGIDGITVLDVEPFQPEEQLPGQPNDPQIGTGCQVRRDGTTQDLTRSRFNITGRGGLAPSPTDALPGFMLSPSFIRRDVESDESQGLSELSTLQLLWQCQIKNSRIE
ncbi:filamentous hemagglutinin N-terminal domain-containing protein [Spirulina subsalsa]|uniref:two-partner secretion domain-containing protein n=1 Tax=Spirulina subsalsa TaxID=54311 RepID=UPI0003751A9F|nr:filamentous hemagglutinin N-terminal domain-containing protein [Spirulina subsalsa]